MDSSPSQLGTGPEQVHAKMEYHIYRSPLRFKCLLQVATNPGHSSLTPDL